MLTDKISSQVWIGVVWNPEIMSLEANGTYQHVNGKSEGGHGWSELNFQYAKLAQRLRTLQAMQNGFVQPERNPAFSHFSTNTSGEQSILWLILSEHA